MRCHNSIDGNIAKTFQFLHLLSYSTFSPQIPRYTHLLESAVAWPSKLNEYLKYYLDILRKEKNQVYSSIHRRDVENLHGGHE